MLIPFSFFPVSRQVSLSESSLGILDDFELVSRAGPPAQKAFVGDHIGELVVALISAARSLRGRKDLLRVTSTLRNLLWSAPRETIRGAVAGIASSTTLAKESIIFAEPLLKIAIERVSDAALSSHAADALASLLGSTALNDLSIVPAAHRAEADREAAALVTSLLTEVALSSSPHALAALGALLRRDYTRLAFCRRDGVSTLAATLATDPARPNTSIGEAVATEAGREAEAVSATYHAVFAVWLLSFAASDDAVQEVLRQALSSRLVSVLAKLLDHACGRRLKIARVVLATLNNLARGKTDLHARIRREMIGAGLPRILQRTQGHLTTVGSDVDAVADMEALLEALRRDQETMSTVDEYIAELRTGVLRQSEIHTDEAFWALNAEHLVSEVHHTMPMLSEIVCDESEDVDVASQKIACGDLTRLIRLSVTGRVKARGLQTLKKRLMVLMASSEDIDLRRQALVCVQLLLLSKH